MSELGQKRRVGLGSPAHPCPVFPVSDQNRVALQYVAKCHSQPIGFIRHRNKTHLYSITSSARPSSDNGTVIPSVLAVLRLMINSTFEDWTTGRSASLSPFKILPV